MDINEGRLLRLEVALTTGQAWISNRILDADEAAEKARAKGKHPDVLPPCASSARDVRELADAMRAPLEADDPNLWPDEVTRQTGEPPGGETVVAVLLQGPEFEAVQTARILIDWSMRPFWHTDGPLKEPAPAKIKAISQADREGWRGAGPAPDFRLTISLPWWLLADRFEREAGLHDRLAYMAFKNGGPYLRKPDITAHAATLARYGLLNPRQVSAFAHASAHPSTPARLRRHHFGPDGQGCLFAPAESSLGRPEDRMPAQELLPQRPTRPHTARSSRPPRGEA